MLRLALAGLFALFVAIGAHAAVEDHFTGTSAPSGWTFPTHAGVGVSCMNGTIVAGSGGTCSGAVTGESFFNQVTAANADAALAYRTTAVDFNTSRIFWFYFRSSTTGASYIWLNEGVPVTGTNAGVFGATGKALMRVEAQNSGANIGISRYANDASRTRTQWNTGGSAWAAPTVNASTTLTGTYQRIGIEIDGPNRRWRVHVIGQTGTANTPDASMHQVALTDWTLFSFHEGGSAFCNPTCGTTYLAVGEPLTDAATATSFIEWYAEDDGTAVDMWSNGRNAGGTWAIFQNYAYPDVNGVPARFVPLDRTTTALTVGTAGQWDEQQVKDPYVIQDGANFIMMYGGSNAAGKFQVGCASASSADGPWTKCPNNPMAALSAGTSQDQTLNPTLVKDDGEPDANKRWKLIYVGADTSSPIRFRVFVRTCAQPPTNAACDTAAEWSAATQIVDVGGGGAIDEAGWGRVFPVKVGSTLYLFGGVRAISGGAATNRQETYATTTDRWLTSGNLTKSGTVTNPSRGTDCDTTTTAAITTTGSRTFTVASTANCDADEMAVVDDDATSGNYHVNRILNVVNATTLTMYHNEDALASGGRVRAANAFQQVDVGPFRSYAGGYYKLATCFDPMAGSPSTFDAYAEQTCTWTASSPTGPWTPYHRGTPSIPMNSFSRGASNENPSFINLPISATSPGASGISFPSSVPSSEPFAYP